MTFGSVCSGIEAATVAWAPLGWRPLWVAEIDAFPCALLKHYYPKVPNYGDFTKIRDAKRPDVLVGGTPCQSFSVAGKRGGLDDARGVLAFEFLALAGRLRPTWIVFENVPGLLSSDEGRDFGAFVGALGKLGYGWAYRILDAQFFGLAQRRERLFLVGYLGDWRPPVAVLFEPESLRRDTPPSRATRQEVAGTLGGGTGSRGWCDDLDRATFIPDVGYALNAHGGVGRSDGESETFIAQAQAFTIHGTDKTQKIASETNIAGCIRARAPGTQENSSTTVVAFHENQRAEVTLRDTMGSLKIGGGKPGQGYPAIAFNLRGREAGAMPEPSDVASVRSASGGSSRSYVADFPQGWRIQEIDGPAETVTSNPAGGPKISPINIPQMGVRRLTPRECERLQGFPDDYTAIPYRNKPAADGPRYKALGNSMAVPVIRWIGRRILASYSPIYQPEEKNLESRKEVSA